MNQHPQSKTNTPNHTTPAKPSHLLVVCHPDGFIEFYGSNVNLHCVSLFEVQSSQAEVLAEEYARLNMPGIYRELFESHPFATYFVERRSIADQVRVDADLRLIRGLNGFTKRNKEGESTWIV